MRPGKVRIALSDPPRRRLNLLKVRLDLDEVVHQLLTHRADHVVPEPRRQRRVTVVAAGRDVPIDVAVDVVIRITLDPRA